MRTVTCRYCGRVGHNYVRCIDGKWQCTKGNACAERSLRRMKAQQAIDAARKVGKP